MASVFIKEETPIKSSAYWWRHGIYAWANKGQASKPVESKVKRRCETCKTIQSFTKDEIPGICPLCNEGQLLSSREWQITFPEKPQPQTEPKEEPMSAEDEQAKENVMAFLDSFRSTR